METLVATAGLLALGTLTPGPNNMILLRETALGGWKRAMPAMVGIVAGGLGLLAVVATGSSSLLEPDQWLTTTVAVAACLLLAALGIRTVAGSFGVRGHAAGPGPAPAGHSFGWLFVLQFLNPKAWLLVIAAVASIGTPPPAAALAQLVSLFVLIPAASLALWSLAGARATRHLERPLVRAWFDRATGGVLLGFAFLLLLAATEAP